VPVSKGGLGVGTITGVLKGNGTAPIGPVTGNPTDCIFVSGSSGPCPGGGSLTWEQDNTTIGARSIVNVVAGNGINRILTDTGTQIDDQSNIDTAVVQTRQADLLNVDRVITTTSTGTCTFAGTTPISFGLSYPASAGMQLYFTPNMTCDVPTLNVNGLGAKNMYVSNGVHALPTSVGLPQIIAWDPSLNAGAGGWRQAGRVMPFYVTYVAAVCQGAAASMGFTLPPTNAATAVCVTGNQSPNPVIYAVAQFPNGANQIAVQGHFFLPYDWIGVIDVVGKWRTGEVNTSQGVSWQIQTNCVMNNQQAETPAWNPVTVIPREAVISTTAFRHNDFAQGAIDVTNCAAGEELFFRFVRDPNHADDDLAGTAELIQLTFITRRTV
jgi:hypothetical protein